MAATAQQSGFVDPYNYQMSSDVTGYYGDSGIPNAWMKLWGLDTSQLREAAKVADDRAYERASIDSARAWSEYMDNTQYQRRVKDLEAAGLNPWLAVQNGISGTGAPSVDTGGSAHHKTKSGQSSSGLAMLLLGLLRILGK